MVCFPDVESLGKFLGGTVGGVAGFLVVAVLLHAGLHVGLNDVGRKFAALDGFLLWEMLLALELTVWLIALPASWRTIREAAADPRMRPTVRALLILFFVQLIIPFLQSLRGGALAFPLTWGEARVGVLWTLGAVAHAVVLTSLACVGLAAARSAHQLAGASTAETPNLRALFEARSQAQAMLARAGVVLSLAVLATSALFHLVEQSGERKLGAHGATWSTENVIGFGVYNTAVLALAYVPTIIGIQTFATAIRDRLLERSPHGCAPLDWLKARRDLDRQLQTEVDLFKTLTKAAPILAPLLTGILGLSQLGK